MTWTRNSKHGKGMAADLIIDEAWQNPEGYAHLADIAKEEGLRTLGTRDAGHVEMSGEAGVSGETLGALLSDLQGDAGDAARQVRADVNTETEAESRASTMARVANVAQVARVATVASVAAVAAVAKVATVARPGDAMPQHAPASDAYSPLAVSGIPATVTSSDTATHIATPISSVNLADRISRLMDLQATQDAKPLSSVLLRMGNERAQSANSAGPPDDSRVQADGHHPRVLVRLCIQHVERFLEVLREIVGLDEARAVPKAEIVDVGRIGNDQMPLAAHIDKVRRVVVVGV